MTRPINAPTLAAGALVLALGSACGGTQAESTSPPPTAPTGPSPDSSTPQPSATSNGEVAAGAAAALIRRYFAVTDLLGQEKAKPLGELASVATSTQLAAERALLQTQRSKGERQVGNTRIAALRVHSVQLINSNPSAGKVPTVLVDVCWDVSGVDVVDRNGRSIVSRHRPNTGWTRYTIANYRWPAEQDHGWRVEIGQDLREAPCEAS